MVTYIMMQSDIRLVTPILIRANLSSVNFARQTANSMLDFSIKDTARGPKYLHSLYFQYIGNLRQRLYKGQNSILSPKCQRFHCNWWGSSYLMQSIFCFQYSQRFGLGASFKLIPVLLPKLMHLQDKPTQPLPQLKSLAGGCAILQKCGTTHMALATLTVVS